MAFRATNILPQNAYNEIKGVASQLKSEASARSAQFSATGADAAAIVVTIQRLAFYRDRLAELSTVPGLAVYAQEQEDDPTYNVATEFSTLQTLINTAISDISAALPRAGGGYVLLRQVDSSGAITERSFTPAQLSVAIAPLDAIVAQIA